MNNKKIEEKAINLVIENLENILNNPANPFLPINVKDIIETSTRLLKVESDTLTQYKEVLREAIPFIEDAIRWYELKGSVHQEFISEDKEFLSKAKQLLKDE